MRCVLIVLLFSFCSCIAQTDSTGYAEKRYGLYSHYNINNHSADFKRIPDCPNCSPGFETGKGSGFSFGALYETPLSSLILLSLRLGYYNFSADLFRNETTTVIVGGVHQDGVFEHSFKTNLASVGVEPIVSYNLFGNLLLNAGLHIGYVVTKGYDQKEEIVQPKGVGTFLDENGNDSRERTRNVFKGDMKEASAINLSPLFGISYEFPLNSRSTLIAAPELFYTMDLLPVVNSSTVKKWTSSSIRIGIALKYQPSGRPGAPPLIKEKIEKRNRLEIIDTIIVNSTEAQQQIVKAGKGTLTAEVKEDEDYKYFLDIYKRTDTLFIPIIKEHILTADIRAVGLDSLDREIPKPTLTIEEFIAGKLQPLLNYVFFDNVSYILPERYSRLNSAESLSFDENNLFHYETLPTYYHLLNIVGNRMKKFPKANLRIVGCNADVDEEKGDKNLSQKRAETVRNYFRFVWGLDDSRMQIEARNLSEKPSTPIQEKDKIDENRRVELYSDEYEILAPVFTQDTVREVSPPTIRFYLESQSSASLTGWEIGIMQKKQNIKCIDSSGEISSRVDWRISEDPYSIPRIKAPLDFSLTVIDNEGHAITTDSKSIGVQLVSVAQKRSNRESDKEIDHYSLILFDFDKADIGGTNKRIIDFIRSRTKQHARISISGFTDRTGDFEYNLKLSEKRAKVAERSLGFDNANSIGVGKQKLIFDNDLPEGRFYCRTVFIDIETDVK